MTMIRKIASVLMLLLVLSAFALPGMAAGGNGGSSGADEAGSSGSGGSGNGGGSAGPSGDAPGSPSGPQDQPLQEAQERRQEETIDQPGVQLTQHDRDQTQGRTGVDAEDGSPPADLARQRDRDVFLEQVRMLQENASHDRDRDRVDVALSALALSGNVTGSAGPELARLRAEVNGSYGAVYQAEQRIAARSSVSRMLFGGDREAAGLLVRYADQNWQRIQEMEHLLMACSDCDPQVRVMLEEQVQVLAEEQNRLRVLGEQEQGDQGLFGWLFR